MTYQKLRVRLWLHFADDTTILSVARTETEAKHSLQNALISVLEWTRKWCIKLNSSKSTPVDVTNKSTSGNSIFMDDAQISYAKTAKYFRMALDAKFRWNEHVEIKIMGLQLKWKKLKWPLGRKSKLSIQNKLLMLMLWTYGAQLWGCTSEKKNVNIIQRFQNKILRCIANVPWCIRTSDLHRDLGVNTVKKEIENIAIKHNTRLRDHVITEALSLADPIGLERSHPT